MLKRKRVSRLIRWFVIIIVLAAFGAFGFAQRRSLTDWFILYNYHPPSAVQQLASDTMMDNYGRRIFYVNHPQVDDKTTFNDWCRTNSEQTIVLGCYHSDQQGIHLLSVSDVRLNGVEEVTAAHEMLHAAYDRLSSNDRSYVDGLLMDYYDHSLHDQRIIDTINAYKQTEPGQVVNEMHSVFGTEVASLPPPLENYYKRYFNKRQVVAKYASQYQEAFTSRQAQVKSYDAKLASITSRVTADETSLTQQITMINAARAQLDLYKSTGNINAYNAGVPKYNSSVSKYNKLVDTTRRLVNEYNQIVGERNALALEERQLVKAIDSSVTSISN